MPDGSTLSTSLQPVRPGDLIEADLFNRLIAAIGELEDRITKLQAECRKTPDPGVRPLKIETAVVKVGTDTLSFTVTGSGLDPNDLVRKFTVTSGTRSIPFEPENLEGDDNAISFTANPSQFEAAATSVGMVTRAVGTAEVKITISISAKRGVSDTHALELERIG